MYFRFFAYFLMVGLCASSICYARSSTPIKIPFDAAHEKVMGHLSFRLDHPRGIDSAKSFPLDEGWSPFSTLSREITTSKHVWFKIDLLLGPDTGHHQDLLLAIESTFIDHVEIYLLGDDTHQTFTAGTIYPLEQRTLPDRYFLQPLHLGLPGQYSLVFKTSGVFAGDLIESTSLWVPEHYFTTRYSSQILTHGWHIGVLGILALLHAIAIFTYRNSLWVYSFTFIFSALCILLLKDGFVATGLAGQEPWWIYKGIWCFTLIHSMAAILMSRRVLCPGKLPLYQCRSLVVASILNGLAIPPIILASNSGAATIGTILTAINLLVFSFLLFIALIQARTNDPGARGYLVGWGTFTVSCWISGLSLFGYLGATAVHTSYLIVISVVAISIWLYLFAVGATFNKHKSLLETQNHIAGHLGFISHLTSEVRSSLNGIVGTSELLRGELKPDQQKHMSTIQRAGRRLHHLINNIQDLTVVGSYRVRSENIPFRLDRVLSRLKHENNGAPLSITINSAVPLGIVGDATRWMHTFDTLMDCSLSTGSSLKVHTDIFIDDLLDDTAARIRIRWTSHSASSYSPKLLETTNLESIAQNENEGRNYGLQLALFLCQSFMESQDGALHVTLENHNRTLNIELSCLVNIDSLEQGKIQRDLSTLQNYSIALPYDIDSDLVRYLANEIALQTVGDSEDAYDLCLLDASQVDARLLKKQIGRINSSKIGIIDASNSILDSNPKAFPLDSDKAVGDLIAHVAEQLTGTSLSSEKGHEIRALVIEDDSVCRQIITKILTDIGASVECATDGLQGLDISNSHEFDILFIDCELPLMNGFALTTQIRTSTTNPNQNKPIIAVTAHRKNETAEKLYAAGTSDIIHKPVNSNTIRELISRVINELEKEAPLIPSVAPKRVDL